MWLTCSLMWWVEERRRSNNSIGESPERLPGVVQWLKAKVCLCVFLCDWLYVCVCREQLLICGGQREAAGVSVSYLGHVTCCHAADATSWGCCRGKCGLEDFSQTWWTLDLHLTTRALDFLLQYDLKDYTFPNKILVKLVNILLYFVKYFVGVENLGSENNKDG